MVLLQNWGAIAKFGTVPISDIAAYFELRNSKVTSSVIISTLMIALEY